MRLWHEVVATIFGADPVRVEVADLIARMQAGEVVDKRAERKRVDLKEEADRRDRAGHVLPGASENEAAAASTGG